jgi:hypothetical protein
VHAFVIDGTLPHHIPAPCHPSTCPTHTPFPFQAAEWTSVGGGSGDTPLQRAASQRDDSQEARRLEVVLEQPPALRSITHVGLTAGLVTACGVVQWGVGRVGGDPGALWAWLRFEGE